MCPEKVGTGPMAFEGIVYWPRLRKKKEGDKLVSKHQIQPGYMENELADAGRDCGTCLARPNSEAQTGTANDPPPPLFSCPRAQVATIHGQRPPCYMR